MALDSGQNRLGSCKMPSTMTVLDVLTSQSAKLIRDEVRAASSRLALERGIVQAIRDHGCSIDEVSAQVGYTPDEIRELLATPLLLDDLDALSGTR